MENKIDYKKQGKSNRAAGARFEKKTRDDLEKNGWIVSRWGNNVEFEDNPYNVTAQRIDLEYGTKTCDKIGKLVPSKSTRFRSNTHGFPDFIAFRHNNYQPEDLYESCQEVIGVECKSNGYLKPEEKEKCKWLLSNNLFSKILISKKGKKRGEIEYVKFKE